MHLLSPAFLNPLIRAFVWFHLWFGITLVIGMMVFLTIRQRRSAHASAVRDLLQGSLAQYVSADSRGPIPTEIADYLPRGNRYRPMVRDCLIAEINVMAGTEREWLIELYREGEFLREDLADCHHRSGYVRLQAVHRLEQLGLGETAGALLALTRDRRPLVALSALRAFSVLPHPENRMSLIKHALKALLVRQDILREVVLNIARIRGAGELVSAWSLVQPEPVQVAIIEALGTIQATESVSTLLSALWQAPSFRVIETIAEALGQIGDPVAITSLQRLLEHESPRVRSRAAWSLQNLGDALPPRFVAEESAIVQRKMRKRLA